MATTLPLLNHAVIDRIESEEFGIRRVDADIAAKIRCVGFHPFVMIRIEGERPSENQYFVCKTQNDLAKFVRDLQALPRLSECALLSGLEQALKSEIYEAAERWFSWVRQAPSGALERVYLGTPANMDLAGYYGYPIYEASSRKGSDSSERRLEVLESLFNAYVRTDGNNATRLALAEALAFALSRCLGYRHEYEKAALIVDRALSLRPKSIHLKAARQALALKLDGKMVPDRLVKFIGDDNGYLKQFVCPLPFERFEIGPSGDVLVCCGHWLPTSIGNFLKDSIDGILNSPNAQKIRKSVTDGSYKYCNHLDCGHMIQETLPTAEELERIGTRNAVATRDYHVKGIDYLTFGLDQTCNLSCPSCRTHRIVEKASASVEKARAVEEKLVDMLPTVRILHVNPAGELFGSKSSRKLLELIDDGRCPDLRLDIISNGTLFSEEEWNKFPGIHNKVRSIRISVDAARKETFEKLRRLAVWEPFVENMCFLSRLRAAGTIPQLKFSFTYQVDNFREMPEFVEFCASMNCDFSIFERLQNIVFSPDEYRHKAVHYRDHPLHAEFLDVVGNPIFADARVFHDFDYDGAAKMASDDARKRLARLAGATLHADHGELPGSGGQTIPKSASAPISGGRMRVNSQIYDIKDFIYIAAMPKAASSLAWLILSSIQEPNNRPDQTKIAESAVNVLMPMSIEFLETFKRGGVFKNHAPLEYHNDRFLKQTGCKYVVLMRHPADHLVALYCHMQGHPEGLAVPAERRTQWGFSLGQYPEGVSDRDPSSAIAELISCGYLFKCLQWMSDWNAFRHPQQSRLIRYEDIICDFHSVVTELCFFVRGAGPDEDLMRYLAHVHQHEATEGHKKSRTKYPHGWTGRIGVWKEYFSPSNVDSYNRMLEGFMKSYPQAAALLSIYPDLAIKPF